MRFFIDASTETILKQFSDLSDLVCISQVPSVDLKCGVLVLNQFDFYLTIVTHLGSKSLTLRMTEVDESTSNIPFTL